MKRVSPIPFPRSRLQWPLPLLSALILPLLLMAGCRVHDVRTVTIHAPDVRTEQSAESVRKALSVLEGVDSSKLEFDLAKGTVSVTYDSMLVAIKNLEHAVADAGFAVDAKPYPLPAKKPPLPSPAP